MLKFVVMEVFSENSLLEKHLGEIPRIVNSLKSEDRSLRKRSLKVIGDKLLECSSLLSEQDYYIISLRVYKSLLLCLSDPVEKCRESAANSLSKIIKEVSNIEEFVPSIIPVFVQRLRSEEIVETSEEVRLKEIEILGIIVKRSDDKLFQFTNDIVCILVRTITDPCPDIKRESCAVTVALAAALPSKFHMVSELLVNPLLHTLSHQHAKTRIASINALGSVVQYGNNKCVEDAASHLAQRLFDQSPAVRLAVTKVVGTWLIELVDRYSFFHRLIPLLLSSLLDDVSEVRSTAKELWEKAGKLYLLENEAEYKGKIDFPKIVSDDHPFKDSQPSLGCRILVQRYMCNILPSLFRDMQNWVAETRLKSIKLLYTLLLHSEENITINLQKVLLNLITAAKDEEEDIVQMANKSAELLGYFVEPQLWCDDMLPIVHNSPSASHLSILASIIRGCSKSSLNTCFCSVYSALSDPAICRVTAPEEQAHLLMCVQALLKTTDSLDSTTTGQIFNILISVCGLSQDEPALIKKAESLLEVLASSQSLSSANDLYNLYAMPMLKQIIMNYELWTIHSPEMRIFCFLIKTGCGMEEVMNLAIPVLINNLQVTKDPKLRNQMFAIVTVVLQQIPDGNVENIASYLVTLILDGIFPNLLWYAGKSAAALRTVAVACLSKIINSKYMTSTMIAVIGDQLLTHMVTLLDDDLKNNRLLACKILAHSFSSLTSSVDEHRIHNLYPEFLKRMDDADDDVRICATKIFKSYFKSFPSTYDWLPYKMHIKELYKGLLVHMDDDNNEVQTAVLELLKEAASISPAILLHETEAVRFKHRNAECCDELVNYVKDLKVSDLQ